MAAPVYFRSIDTHAVAMISHSQGERLQAQISAMTRARMIAACDYHKGREGPGAQLHEAIKGGALPIMGRGVDTPSYNLYDAHLGGLLPVMGGDLPVMGGGFGSFLKKLGSLGKKVVAHGAKAFHENKGRLAEIGQQALSHAANGTGSLGERLKGGIAQAASATHDLARSQAVDRLRGLIA